MFQGQLATDMCPQAGCTPCGLYNAPAAMSCSPALGQLTGVVCLKGQMCLYAQAWVAAGAAGAAVTVLTVITMVVTVTKMTAGAAATGATVITMVVMVTEMAAGAAIMAATTRTAVGEATTVTGATPEAKALVRCT